MAAQSPLDNETLARQICQHREWNGSRFAGGSFIAIADGRVVGVGDTYEHADMHLVAAGLPPGEGLICEVAEVETDVVRRESLQCL